MHECRIYKGHPDQGGRLVKTLSADQCRARFWQNAEKTENTVEWRETVCEKCVSPVKYISKVTPKFCKPCAYNEQIERSRKATKKATVRRQETRPDRFCTECNAMLPKDFSSARLRCSKACILAHKSRTNKERYAKITRDRPSQNAKYRLENGIVCGYCKGPIPDEKPLNAKYCSHEHQRAYFREAARKPKTY